MPMVRAPPGRFSTTTLAPSCRPSSGASRRATLSVALPAACGTTSRIGRSGYCAPAPPAETSKATVSSSFIASGLQLAADFAALVGRGVDVHVEITGLERLHLSRVQLGPGGDGIGVAVL